MEVIFKYTKEGGLEVIRVLNFLQATMTTKMLKSSYYLIEIQSYGEILNISKDLKRELEGIEDMAGIHDLNIIKVDRNFSWRDRR